MDQMVSGSGLYPPRLLDPTWLTEAEATIVDRLGELLAGTGNPHGLAMDMLSILIYNVDVRIILDNSGSMQLDMFGNGNFTGGGSEFIEQTTIENPQALRQVYAKMKRPSPTAPPAPPNSPISPTHRRWYFARDALQRWRQAFSIMGLDPDVYLLNSMRGVVRNRLRCSQLDGVFKQRPGGGTPMTEVLRQALGEHQSEAGSRPLLLLVITDGEANDMNSFNALLDEVQNGVYGDAQVCFMGLSLVPRDIEWFENEECDETRIRTVEAYEVEQRQIQLREVVGKEGGYNFQMHTFRVLLTNFFPADYDYEAPLQNLRHRLYITCHGRDRWWGLYNPCWRLCISNLCCTACFLATGCHGCGWCQGNECCSCKCEKPPLIESCCEEE